LPSLYLDVESTGSEADTSMCRVTPAGVAGEKKRGL
jgi:hypothetical protein